MEVRERRYECAIFVEVKWRCILQACMFGGENAIQKRRQENRMCTIWKRDGSINDHVGKDSEGIK